MIELERTIESGRESLVTQEERNLSYDRLHQLLIDALTNTKSGPEQNTLIELNNHVEDLTKAVDRMIDQALSLLGGKYHLNIRYVQNEEGQTEVQHTALGDADFEIKRLNGGDLPQMRFSFKNNGQSFDIVLIRTRDGVYYEEYLLAEKKWRRPKNEIDGSNADFYSGKDLLFVEDRLQMLADKLEIAADFATNL